MMEQQLMGLQGMCHIERQRQNALYFHLLRDEYVRIGRENEFFDGILGAYFPNARGAQKELIVGIDEKSAHRCREAARLQNGPQEDMRVKENVQGRRFLGLDFFCGGGKIGPL